MYSAHCILRFPQALVLEVFKYFLLKHLFLNVFVIFDKLIITYVLTMLGHYKGNAEMGLRDTLLLPGSQIPTGTTEY